MKTQFIGKSVSIIPEGHMELKTIPTIFKKTLLVLAGLGVAASAWAYIPEPQSAGKYVLSKGTRAEEGQEDRAGASVYDYNSRAIEVGPVRIKPDASYRYTMEDNVFWEDRNEKSDNIHTIVTDTRAELPLSGGQHLFTTEYRSYTELFNRFHKQDHTDHRLSFGLDLNYVPFTLNAEHAFERTVSRANTEFTTRVKRDEHATHTLLEIPFASFFLENEITNFNINYQEVAANDIFDHNDFTVFQRIGYDLSPNTQILGEYAYKNIDYDVLDNHNGDANQFMAGMRGSLNPRMVYQAWLGTQLRIYDDDTRPDFTGFAARGALQYQLTELSTLTVSGDRSPQESTFDDQSFYVRNRIDVAYERQIAERWFAKTGGSYDFHEYSRITVLPTGQSDTREDSTWSATAGLEYRLPNDILSVLFEYRFDSRHSNLVDFDYDANALTAGVRAKF